MKLFGIRFFFCTILLLSAQKVFCEVPSPEIHTPAKKSLQELDEILENVENRYALPGFSAHFFQVSTLKDMQIKDTASGTILVKRPGMMRWDYEKPERQIIITDGKTLWIHRPEENQVLIGRAPYFFGDGKGAGFLSDIKLIRRKFTILLEKTGDVKYHVLKLLPGKKTIDFKEVVLSISKKTFDVVQIVTYNAYGDETRIELSHIAFLKNPDDSMFSFMIPEGTDVLKLDE